MVALSLFEGDMRTGLRHVKDDRGLGRSHHHCVITTSRDAVSAAELLRLHWEAIYGRAKHWASVKQELLIARGLLILLYSDNTAGWSTTVDAVDSCESGYAVVQT